jgi:hypothetical protein
LQKKRGACEYERVLQICQRMLAVMVRLLESLATSGFCAHSAYSYLQPVAIASP